MASTDFKAKQIFIKCCTILNLNKHHLISSQSLNLGGRRGTTDDVAKIAVHLSCLPLPYSLKLHSHLFFCLPLFLDPFTAPCRIVFTMPEDLEMWSYHLCFRFFTVVRYHHAFCTSSFVTRFLVGNVKKSLIASHRKSLDPSLNFCSQGPALTGIKEGA